MKFKKILENKAYSKLQGCTLKHYFTNEKTHLCQR